MRGAASTIVLALALAAQPAVLQAQFKPPATSPRPAVWIVEQLIIAGPLQPRLAAQLQPLKTLDQVEDLLKGANIPFGWQTSQLNTATLDPALISQIERLPPGEVFVIPSGGRVFISVIVGRR